MRENIHYQIDEYYLDLQKQGQEMKIIGEAETRQNPFPGLRPFRTAEAHLFFGRDGQAEDLIQRLMKTHFLGVLGNSGGGKSSLVRAGLIPALHRGRRQEQVSDWKIVLCRPGASPLDNLAAALASARLKDTSREVIEPEVTRLLPVLKDSSFGLLEVEEGAGEYDKTLLIIDQFEELFRFHADMQPGEAGHFVDLLLTAVQQPDTHIYVVITMRSEFLGECVRYRGLPEIINEGQYLVPRLTGENVRRAVAGPLAVVGAPLDGALANRLVREVGDNMDQLPVLQHALMRTYRHWQARETTEPVSHADYEAVGGMEKALGNHADELLGSLDPQQQKIARLIFQRITDLSTGDKGGRRPTRMEEIYGVCESVSASRNEVNAVINKFRQMDTSFLMPPPGVTLQDDSMLDISHESLIRNWSKLNQWAKEEAANARQYGRLHQDRQYRDDGQLTWLTGALLQTLTEWRNREHVNYWWAGRYHPEVQPLHDWNQHKDAFKRNMEFLKGSEEEADNQEKQRQETIAREERQKQKTRYRTIIAVLSVVAAVVGLGLAIFAYNQRNMALEAKAEADISALVASEQRDIARIEKLKADSSAVLAFEQKQLAEQKSREAEINLGLAKKEEARALVALELVKKEKNATEEQRKRAEENYAEAQKATESARAAKDEAERNLESLKKANEAGVRALLNNVRENIKDQRCREALNKINQAFKLKVLADEVTAAYLDNINASLEAAQLTVALETVQSAFDKGLVNAEMLANTCLRVARGGILNIHHDTALLATRLAVRSGGSAAEASSLYFELSYWHCETGSLVQSSGLLDTAYQLSGRRLFLSGTDTATLHSAMRKLDLKRYEFLHHRYYPKMVNIPGGTFGMGSLESDTLSDDDERPVHRVTLSSYSMSETEVTVYQFAIYCALSGLDIRDYIRWPNSGDNPVVNVSWYDAVEYANWLSSRLRYQSAYRIEKETGDEGNYKTVEWIGSTGYRLPTEAEWEYAAGNGARHTRYSWGDGNPSGKKGGNVADETAKEKNPGWTIFDGYRDGYVYTAPVGSFDPNDFGLYDMSGNVWEWCWDWKGSYPTDEQVNPRGAEKGGGRVYRGGSWLNEPRYCRAAFRNYFEPSSGFSNLGFRLASSLQ
jgi:formylglycine-generating enzyme required for sulfatase activity